MVEVNERCPESLFSRQGNRSEDTAEIVLSLRTAHSSSRYVTGCRPSLSLQSHMRCMLFLPSVVNVRSMMDRVSGFKVLAPINPLLQLPCWKLGRSGHLGSLSNAHSEMFGVLLLHEVYH